MDFKTTTLTKEVVVEEEFYPEISGLHFGYVAPEKSVFDYTAYFEENDIEPIDYKVFMRTNKHLISSILKTSDTKSSELFFINTNGHVLVAADLAILFLCVANHHIHRYFSMLLIDLMTNGVAFANGLIYALASERMTSDVLEEIIKERQNDSADNQ